MDTNDKPRLFLLDAYALIFRAYYALIKMPRTTSKGFNTSAIYGFVSTLEELLRTQAPTHVAVAFDPPGPTFRHEAYEAYKGEREATPEDIKLSVPIIKDIIRAYRIPILEVEGFEADDVIGTMAVKAAKAGFQTYMMTPDKDFGQLVSDDIYQYKPSYRGSDFEVRTPAVVCERYGIERPEQVIDLLALMGDKADNIPGCPGVGEKTAVKLIAEYGSVDGIIEHTDDLKGALRTKIKDGTEQIIFSKYLATIRTDVPLEQEPDELKVQEPDEAELKRLFTELEFRTLESRVLRRIRGERADTARSPEPQARPGQAIQPSLFDMEEQQRAEAEQSLNTSEVVAITDATPEQVLGAARVSGRVSLLTMADGPSDMNCVPLGWAIAVSDERVYYLDAKMPGAAEAVCELLCEPELLTVTADVKRDYVVLRRLLPQMHSVPSHFYDISLAHYLLEPEHRHSTEALAQTYLHLMLSELESVVGKGAKRLSPQAMNASLLAPWVGAHASAILRLYEPLKAQVQIEGLTELLTHVEFPLSIVLADMELTGVCVDVQMLHKASEQMQSRLRELEGEIYELAGMEFNVGSPAKVGEVLFDHLKLDPKAKKTKTGQYSTSEEVLERLSDTHPIIHKILEYRQMKKLLSTYLTALPQSINPQTGCIHTTYNQTVTATGRISSSDPNLQNIPVRDEMGRDIRRAFVPREGELFLSADYSQIELRLVADMAGDEVMIDAFERGADIHAITAAKIYHEDEQSVSSEQRRKAKTANFGILYGISAFGLANRLNIPRSEAKELIEGYFATFPTIRQYMERSIEQAREQGYVSTIHGRRRRLPDINSRNPVVRGYAERNAINAPIQGSAADIIKIAMVRIHAEMRERGLRSVMTMQVHDELNFSVVPSELPVMQELVERQMRGAYQGRVKMSASMGVADNWLDAH